MATLQNPATYNGLKEAYETHLVSASPRRTGKLSGISGATTSTSGGTLTLQAIKDFYATIKLQKVTTAYTTLAGTAGFTTISTGQLVQYGGGIEGSNIINKLDHSINQIQLVLDRKDTILL